MAKLRRGPVSAVHARNGVVLRSPAEVNLAFLFHEIWIEEVYTRSRSIRAGDTVIDIGANIGVFAAFAATRAPGVRVLAFEPFPENYTQLQENVEASGLDNVELFEKAVSGSSGNDLLRSVRDNWAVHSVGPGGTRPVATISLDDLFAESGIDRCDLLKIDCEGSEYEIFENASAGTFRRIGRIVGEYHEWGEGQSGERLATALTANGFTIEELVPLPEHRCGYFEASNRIR